MRIFATIFLLCLFEKVICDNGSSKFNNDCLRCIDNSYRFCISGAEKDNCNDGNSILCDTSIADKLKCWEYYPLNSV